MNSSSIRKTLLIGILVLVLGGGGGLLANRYHKDHSHNQSTNAENTWAEYSSPQFGFKFEYLKQWGTPKVTAQTSAPKNTVAGAPQVTKFTGVQYIITFPDTQNTTPVTATLDSSDYSIQTCIDSDQCSTVNAFTQTDIKNALSATGSNSAQAILNKGANFYSSLNYLQDSGVLTINQLVDLSKIKVSAASLTYTLVGAASDCKNNALSSGSSRCITQAEYNNLSQFAGSLQPF